ncbi:hypothetical protein SPLC1_S050980 [Arthrospira platensis C1]|nr:hypothetical protein SPLC1_S050980 [Arthrospira platensis C1]
MAPLLPAWQNELGDWLPFSLLGRMSWGIGSPSPCLAEGAGGLAPLLPAWQNELGDWLPFSLLGRK